MNAAIEMGRPAGSSSGHGLKYRGFSAWFDPGTPEERTHYYRVHSALLLSH
jgi:hypothetical protein